MSAPESVPLELSLEERARLERDILQRNGRPAQPTIPRRGGGGRRPLSFAQQRLWFLDRLDNASPAYNIPSATRVRGPLVVDVVERALAEVVARHEALRTTFISLDGTPMQETTPAVGVPLKLIDLSAWPAAQRDAEARTRVQQEAERPFDLSHDLMLRATLLRLGPDDHILLVVTHHIASDGWSSGVFFREFAALYEAFSEGKRSPLAELPIQYTDFAEWQRTWLQGDTLDRQLEYWRRQLADAVPLDLPLDKPRPPRLTFTGAAESESLPAGLSEQVRSLAQRERATLFMILLAAFQALLFRYTQQEDVSVGTVIAGRTRKETEPLIGFFANTLVMRTSVAGDPTFRELLARVRETALAAYAHQDLPFERLVEELRPERALNRTPLFQAMFVLQNAPREVLKLKNLDLERQSLDQTTAKFELTLAVADSPLGIRTSLVYNTDLFEAGTIRRMLGHFRTLLESAVAAPGRRISDLALLSDAERDRILVQWNRTATNYPRDATIQGLFESQAASAPETCALEYEDRRVSYRELNERANQVAHRLRALGVAPETFVGVCMERSVELIAALLGVLKAGGAYVPLDPAYPQERLAYMFEDTRMPVLIAQESLLGSLPTHGGPTLVLDPRFTSVSAESRGNPMPAGAPENLAYVIYTSGSTGKPKGVMVPHRAVVRLVQNTNYVQLGPGEVFLQCAPISFDASTLEIWGALLNGAKLAILPPHTPSLEELGKAIHRHKATTLWLTAGLFHAMVDERLADLNPVRQLLAGGDALSVPHVRRFVEALGDGRLINGYGPTENTTFTCCWRVEGARIAGSVPIGRPIANTQVYILDRKLQPVPVGAPGELHAGGDGLARGYLNLPDLTAEKFIRNPFSADAASRLYKTGDLASFLPDGSVEFLGRIDQQVKVRGFRIEPEEIEIALAAHPSVREAVVVARQDSPGDKILVAYVTPQPGYEPDHAALRHFLAEKLPDYMVPSKFVVLERLPLTGNGKVDRRALPAPARTPASAGKFVTPRDSVELRLAMIWEQLLGASPIGVTENFFDLGGHSLMAVRLFSHIERTFGKALPLSTLFQAPTIEQLARTLHENRDDYSVPTIIPIQPRGSAPPLFCVSRPNVNALGYAFLARHLGPNQPVYGLQSHCYEDRVVPYSQSEYETKAAEYIDALNSVHPAGPVMLTGYCEGAHIAFEMARQLTAAGRRVAMLSVLDAWPIENTMSPFFLYATYYISRAQEFFRLSRLEQRRFLAEKARTVWRRLSRRFRRSPAPAPAALTAAEQGQRAHQAMRRRYWPGRDFRPPTYPGTLVLFRLAKQPIYRVRDREMGWKERALGGVHIEIIPGRHTTILRPPNVKGLAEKMTAAIRASLANTEKPHAR